MKRSEVIESIIYTLRSNYPIGADEFEDLANSILNTIEADGMLPPVTVRYIDQPSGNTLCSEVCEWDDE